jgi:hypothetical protein
MKSGRDKIGSRGEPKRVNMAMVEQVHLHQETMYPSSWVRFECAQQSNPLCACPSQFVMGWSLVDLNDAKLSQMPFLIRPNRSHGVFEGGKWNVNGCQHALDSKGLETRTPPRAR